MKRKFWTILDNWKNLAENKMPLLVIGPRQVGKTYIINKFCEEKYKNYCYINLFEDKRIIEWFKTIDTFEKKVEILEITYDISLEDNNTILFIDEVQESEEFIEALKPFCEKGYTNIICAGSLLGVKLKRFNKSYPVGKVYEENMYPMDFEEYLLAIGKERYIEPIYNSFEKNEECLFHKELMMEFKRFLFLGGMPRIIQEYINKSQDLAKINKNLIKNIVSSYILDMRKYNKDNKENIRIERIFRNIPSQLAKENQKFTFSKLDSKDNRKRDYITALDWLIASRLVLPCTSVNTPSYPLMAYTDNETYKLFLNDTGISSSMTGINSPSILYAEDYSFKGVLTENYVATELVKFGIPLYFWTRKNAKGNAEVDFLIQVKENIIPVEVKAGTDTKSKSLEIYNEKFNPELMIRISARNFGYNEERKIKSIPLYATFCIEKLLEE